MAIDLMYLKFKVYTANFGVRSEELILVLFTHGV